MEVENNTEIEQQNVEIVESKELTKESAMQIVIQRALNVNGVLKGIAETIKALENQKVKLIFLADDCDNDQYKETLTALANQFNVKIVSIECWEDLKDYCKLGMSCSVIRAVAEEKGKEPKIKPRCSCASIVDFGDIDTEAFNFLMATLEQ